MQIGVAGNKLKSIEQRLQVAKEKLDELANSLDSDAVKKEIETKKKSRDNIEASLSTIDDEISSLHKVSSLTTQFELNKSTLEAKERELKTLKEKHGDKIKALLNVQELQEIKLKNTLGRIHQQLVRIVNRYSYACILRITYEISYETLGGGNGFFDAGDSGAGVQDYYF